jgi:CHAD domain-containing protein
MPLSQENTRPVFRKLSRQAAKLASRPTPENIHRFRTSTRRVEVLVTDLSQEQGRNDKKLLKLLSRLRKKAGRIRDLDVEISALHSLKIPSEPVRKSQLMRTLVEERGKREKRLIKTLDKKTLSETRRRLKRSAGSLEISKSLNPLVVALKKVNELEVDQGAVSEETLHRFRIAGKRARYIAEMAGKNAEATQLVEQLKHMQDALGDWHDWAQLAQKAEKLFGGVQDSALVSALHNVSRAKFRQAVNTLNETRPKLAGKKTAPIATMGRRPSRPSSAPDSAVA